MSYRTKRKKPIGEVEIVKEMVAEVRSKIKDLVAASELPNIKYQVTRLEKPNHQVIEIKFDGKAVTNYYALCKKLETTFKKYSRHRDSESGTVRVKVSWSLKGEWKKTNMFIDPNNPLWNIQ
ncbi:hypothetical protein NIES2100_35310 [Calothrix sp. NIES-2100]|uniref:hypothetical protein n=1 Tax=Calothrix sp. NIES-2100 TaxID=1954172 RepID=UPI000B60E48F|nr:hypothetical protein NIES2100_35310 [Calothrix sp. NIES-2100]